jgi:hypothetical protein
MNNQFQIEHNFQSLEKALIGQNGDKSGYLFKHTGKVFMISGPWGSGKTYFWKEGRKPEEGKKFKKSDLCIADKLKEANKPNIYISMFGKNSVEEIKKEIFQKAVNLPNKKNTILKKRVRQRLKHIGMK